jgi:hypothetical protein
VGVAQEVEPLSTKWVALCSTTNAKKKKKKERKVKSLLALLFLPNGI